MQLKHCGGKKHSPLMGAGEHPHPPHPSSTMLRAWKGLEIYLSFVNIWNKSNFNIQKLKKNDDIKHKCTRKGPYLGREIENNCKPQIILRIFICGSDRIISFPH